MQHSFNIGPVKIGLHEDFFIMAGPCVIESETLCLQVAEKLGRIQEKTQTPVIFKASFDKANRSSIDSFRGPGLQQGLKILAKVRSETGLPILTDVHEPAQAQDVAETADCLQIPAFLCRQTDLLVACGKTQKPVNVKKGQFVSPEEMKNAVSKIRSTENNKIILTERGTFFGYNRLVNDLTAIPAMQNLGCPVVFDATHSTQQPGGLGHATAGRRDLAPLLARAAVAAGANGLFMEVHPDPDRALCDAECMLSIDQVEPLIHVCKTLFQTIRNLP